MSPKKLIPKTKKILIHPIFIGLLAIIFILSYFLYRTISIKKKKEALQTKLTESHQGRNEIKVPLASPREVFRWINHPHVQLIDIRRSKEYQKKHIESSINLPLEEISKNINKLHPDKLIIIIDKQNTEKGKILVKHFAEQGLNIKYLDGGILKYAQENYPLISEPQTDKISDRLKVSFLKPQEIKTKMLQQRKVFSFVDTRPKEAFQKDHIAGSLNFPLEKIEKVKNHLPAHTILLYDSEPWRSFQAGVKLYDMGIFDVYVCSESYQKLKDTLFKQNSDKTDSDETNNRENNEKNEGQ